MMTEQIDTTTVSRLSFQKPGHPICTGSDMLHHNPEPMTFDKHVALDLDTGVVLYPAEEGELEFLYEREAQIDASADYITPEVESLIQLSHDMCNCAENRLHPWYHFSQSEGDVEAAVLLPVLQSFNADVADVAALLVAKPDTGGSVGGNLLTDAATGLQLVRDSALQQQRIENSQWTAADKAVTGIDGQLMFEYVRQASGGVQSLHPQAHHALKASFGV